jgi:hypothetical protein
MLNEMYRSGNLLNACSYLKSKRTEEYVTALNESYGPGSGQVLITLPVDTTLDLSQATLDFDLSLINGTDEVPLIMDIVQVGATTPASGHFQIEYDGDVSGEIAWDAFDSDVQRVIQGMFPFNGRGFIVSVTGGQLPSPLHVSVSGFNQDNQKADDISAFAIINNLMTDNVNPLLGVPAFYAFNITQFSQFSYPRAEKYFCPFQKIDIVVNNKNVLSIQDYDILYNLLQLSRPTYSRWDDNLLTSPNDEGLAMLPGQQTRRLSINLAGIDLFKQIFPLNIFKGIKITLQLSMQEATQCLIIAGATVDNNNPFSQSYNISNLRLHYYSIELHESDILKIQSVYNSTGVAIPFINFASFTDTIDGSQKNVNVSPQASNVISVLAVMIQNGYNALSSNMRKRSTFLANFLESYRMKLGSYYFPQDTTKCSNIYFYSTDIVNEFKNVMELLNRIDQNSDYLGLETFKYDVTNPLVRIYSTEQQRLLNINPVLAVMTCDIGFKSGCPNMNYFQGVDTSNSSSNYLQLIGMTIEAPETIFIYVATQDSLVFRPGQMVWNH